jgi:hypothetical protein
MADAMGAKAIRGSQSPIAERRTQAWSLDSKSVTIAGSLSAERAR